MSSSAHDYDQDDSDKIFELCSLLEEFKQELELKEFNNIKLENELCSIRKENETLKDCINAKNNQIYSLEESITQLVGESEELQKRLQLKEGDLATIQSCLGILHRQKVEIYDLSNAEQLKLIERLQSDNEKLENKLKKRIDTINKYDDDLNNKDSEIFELKMKLKSLELEKKQYLNNFNFNKNNAFDDSFELSPTSPLSDDTSSRVEKTTKKSISLLSPINERIPPLNKPLSPIKSHHSSNNKIKKNNIIDSSDGDNFSAVMNTSITKNRKQSPSKSIYEKVDSIASWHGHKETSIDNNNNIINFQNNLMRKENNNNDSDSDFIAATVGTKNKSNNSITNKARNKYSNKEYLHSIDEDNDNNKSSIVNGRHKYTTSDNILSPSKVNLNIPSPIKKHDSPRKTIHLAVPPPIPFPESINNCNDINDNNSNSNNKQKSSVLVSNFLYRSTSNNKYAIPGSLDPSNSIIYSTDDENQMNISQEKKRNNVKKNIGEEEFSEDYIIENRSYNSRNEMHSPSSSSYKSSRSYNSNSNYINNNNNNNIKSIQQSPRKNIPFTAPKIITKKSHGQSSQSTYRQVDNFM